MFLRQLTTDSLLPRTRSILKGGRLLARQVGEPVQVAGEQWIKVELFELRADSQLYKAGYADLVEDYYELGAEEDHSRSVVNY